MEEDLTQEERDKICLGLAMAKSALERRECRGAHQRLDHPESRTEFCKTTVAVFEENQAMIRFQEIPKDREEVGR